MITAKHHDGFAMYPSKVSNFNLEAVTKFKRDPMAELSVACKKYGLKFGSGTFMLEAAQQQLIGKVMPTETPDTFRADPIGDLTLSAGEHTLVVRARQIAGANLMRLRQLELAPVK